MESYITLQKMYDDFCDRKINVQMERGWPCKEQLNLSLPMLDLVKSSTPLEHECDYRSYDGTGGILPLKKLFAELLGVYIDEIYIGETMSTTIMYDIINKAMLFGFKGFEPWSKYESVEFLCPVPGYEKHFKICETFNIKMIPVPMNDDGPDMDVVERLAADYKSVKGIWCVPLYSNPTGCVYSDEVVDRLSSMHTKAKDFRIFWDNAYFVHHLTDKQYKIKNILRQCEKADNSDRVFEFASTSKITFPGGGVALCASSKDNIKWLTSQRMLQLKSGDKINQFRHFLFLKNADNVMKHMKRHRRIIAPKFIMVNNILENEFRDLHIVKWKLPKGGYFMDIELLPKLATRVWLRCQEMGIKITPAGSTFPYGNDPSDSHLRLAPTFPDMDDLELAIRGLCLAIKLEYFKSNNMERM